MSVGFYVLEQIKFFFIRCHSVFAFLYLVYIWFPYFVILILLLNLISHGFLFIQISLIWFFFFLNKQTNKLMRLGVLHFLISLWLSSSFFLLFLIRCVSLFFFVLRNAFSMGLYLELPTISLPYFMDVKVRINPLRCWKLVLTWLVCYHVP